MKKLLKIGVYGLSMLILLSLTGASETPDVIYWGENRKLDMDDFQGEPEYKYKYISALTSSGIMHYRGCKNGDIIYKVRAYFEKKESWLKEEARNDYILAHEQLHFDITELYARKLRKLLSERKFKCGEEVAFEHFVNQFTNSWESKQMAYDAITYHSVDREKQQIWHHKIAMELSLLEEFAE